MTAMTTPTPTPAAAEPERILREALNEVAHTIKSGQPAIIDTVWLDSVCPETLLDFVEAALARAVIAAQPAPDATPAPRQDEPQLSREEAALERLQAIIDWCDFAMANPQEFNSHGVRNLDGPIFDKARILLDEATAPRHDAQQPRQNNVERVAAAFGAEMYGDQRPWGSFDGREQDALTRGAVAAIAAIATPAPRQDEPSLTPADMAYFSASDAACYHFPGEGGALLRDAYCRGAADFAPRQDDELAYWKRQAERCAADNVALARLRDEAETKLAALAAGSEPVAPIDEATEAELRELFWMDEEDGPIGDVISTHSGNWVRRGADLWQFEPEPGEDEMATPTPALAPQDGDTRVCTCHPDDNPPQPCPRKYALSECRAAAAPCEPDLLPGLKRARSLVVNSDDHDAISAEIARIEKERQS